MFVRTLERSRGSRYLEHGGARISFGDVKDSERTWGWFSRAADWREEADIRDGRYRGRHVGRKRGREGEEETVSV